MGIRGKRWAWLAINVRQRSLADHQPATIAFTICSAARHWAALQTLGVLAVARQLAEITPWNLIKVILAQGSVTKMLGTSLRGVLANLHSPAVE
jgi:hypothetical protein